MLQRKKIDRALIEPILLSMDKGKAIVLFGARQTGKTTLTKMMLEGSGRKALFLNCDEPDVRELLGDVTSTKLRTIFSGNGVVVIDEAQRVPNIGLTLKLIVDNIEGVQVIATGSSSFELANKTGESLTGRKFEYRLYPLSFGEMVAFHGLLEEKRMLGHRLVFGCYPEVVTTQEGKKDLLNLLADSYLYKDILMMGDVGKPAVLERIVKALALQVGSEVSYNEIATLVGANVQTVERYIDLLEKAFVVFKLPAFSRNVRNELKKSRKIYFCDNGLRNAVIGSLEPLEKRTDVGALWENFLVSERLKLLNNSQVKADGFFWRTTQQQEIDYLEEEGGRLKAFEFKWSDKANVRFSKTFTNAYPKAEMKTVSPANVEEFLLVL